MSLVMSLCPPSVSHFRLSALCALAHAHVQCECACPGCLCSCVCSLQPVATNLAQHILTLQAPPSAPVFTCAPQTPCHPPSSWADFKEYREALKAYLEKHPDTKRAFKLALSGAGAVLVIAFTELLQMADSPWAERHVFSRLPPSVCLSLLLFITSVSVSGPPP